MPNTDRPTAGLRPLFVFEVELAKLVSIGTTPSGEVRLVPILAGTFDGAGGSGTILPGGADWQETRSDGSLEIRARYLLQSQEGELIEVQSNGLRAAAPDVLARLNRGELLDASNYYFRTAIRFRTASSRLARLNDVLAVSYGERRPRSVHLDVYEVL
jgi:Protein of unknown function (DUF3237)